MDKLRQSANKKWKHKQQQTPASEEINNKSWNQKSKIKSNRIVSTADANQRQPSKYVSVSLFVFDLFGNKLNASIISSATLLFCVMLEKVFTVIYTYMQ